jgi:hypothetical protein
VEKPMGFKYEVEVGVEVEIRVKGEVEALI